VLFLVACEGPTGPAGTDGTDALVSTTAEPPGSNCANGGTKVQYGIDGDHNGMLDPSDASGTSYVCNGPGTTSLVAPSTEPPGANCPWGGTKLEQGADTNNNGVLDPAEDDAGATACVCAFEPPAAMPP